MSGSSFNDIEAFVFDAYGTLFDVHSAAGRVREDLGEVADEFSNTWRLKQLQYTWLQSLMGRYEPFWQITGAALDYAMAEHRIVDPQLRARLMELYLQLDPYTEVIDVLTRLKDAGKKTSILSNGDMSMLINAAKNSGVYGLIDRIISVQEVGIFKPHPTVYQLAVDHMRVQAKHIAFQSSNAWDAHGASSFGFVAVWINRQDQPAEKLPAPPQAEIPSLEELNELFSI